MIIRTYGCSYTKYIYPTYADILGSDNTVINQACPGAGNERTFYLLMKDLRERKLKKTDAVVVQWSGPHRFDYLLKNDQWMTYGNIIEPDNKNAKAIWNRIRSWYNPEFELEKTYNYANTTAELLKAYGLKKVYISLTDLTPTIPKSLFLIHDMFKDFEGGYRFSGNTFDVDSPFIDDHPTVREHLDIANKIAANIGCIITPATKQKAMIVHDQIKRDQKFIERTLESPNG